jgi:diadenosine tetraphosphate (Ap4A) HIT family hydrolase
MQPAMTCPFCVLDHSRVLLEGNHGFVVRDAYPVSPGHSLVIPRRHVRSFFELTRTERIGVLELLDEAKKALDDELGPKGYNIGINDGPAAGQTIGHLHIHLIPRFDGDQADPRGGVRWIFPEKAAYWNTCDGSSAT